jgi:hypothetical protein
LPLAINGFLASGGQCTESLSIKSKITTYIAYYDIGIITIGISKKMPNPLNIPPE